MQFIKMHGAGNDYVYVDCFAEQVPKNLPQTARRISDRHFGVGGDGLILIHPSKIADARMQMFNADGSEAEMCGNGLRCLAKYVYESGIARKPDLRIETGNGVLEVQLEVTGQQVQRVRVDLGEPILQADRIPTTLAGNPVVDQPLEVGERTFNVTCVSMGNPHCVIFVDEATDDLVLNVGPQIERAAEFPNRVNVEWVEVHGPAEVRQRTWERGSGETLACGTGAGAVCVAGVLTGRTERKILNHLAGGDLELQWGQDNHVFLTGPAVEVFRGQWIPAEANTDD
ncbi:MAG: diaminopimelate epimerase [Planctomycetales bacterium]|nr:diaminopimelate epimerase [Planctomycetales bacterium]NIM09262.1 diaminopimelate epimerase [Planctomycetales bacterium]NIN08730.1 diaminopimelate epimerase [Planctomycetales bacterium]NIN77848.1 diaminopimelate epimerase [Planctomycetales bacterium]NIO35032.1 diaminopimelate epimerase [Planctomycetales bacterium]